jgi:Protein of unknown function (DUF669)
MASDKKFNWDKFDKQVDLESLQNDVKEVEENGGGDFKALPDGTYEVAVEKLELTESKKGDPMLTIWFNVVAGEFEKSKLFYNKVMQPQNDKAFGIQVHQNNEMLRALWDCKKEDVKFTSFAEYADLVMDIHEDIDGKFEYLLRKETDSKGYDTFEIEEIFEVE